MRTLAVWLVNMVAGVMDAALDVTFGEDEE